MGSVSALPVEGPEDPYEVIHLGGQAAVVVPMDEYRRLRALAELASAEDLERAEMTAVAAAHRDWVTVGRPGAVGHNQVRAMLLSGGTGPAE